MAADATSARWLAESGPAVRLAISLAITAAFAIGGWMLRGVTASGAAAGAAVAFTLLHFGGPTLFGVLVVVFVITFVTTRIGYARKRRLGIAEHKQGRGAGQVLANLAVAAVCTVVAAMFHTVAGLVAAIAAMAEAVADTASSECGEAWSDSAYVITGGGRVPAGTDGAVSLPGTIAGGVAAVIVAALAYLGGMISLRTTVLVSLAGFMGTFIDSILGATLERRGLLHNDAVNFFSTAATALVTFVIVYVAGG